MKRIRLFNESSNYKDIIEDYLLELIDLGWELEKIQEVNIDEDWHYSPYMDGPKNGFAIHLIPPFGINLTNNYGEKFNLIEHFNTCSEWFKTIPSVIRKLEAHIGEVNVTSLLGDRRSSWGGTRWMTIAVKKQKI